MSLMNIRRPKFILQMPNESVRMQRENAVGPKIKYQALLT